MRMRNHWSASAILTAIALMQSSALIAQEAPYAIACTGQLEVRGASEGAGEPEVKVSRTTLIYIVDEARKDVSIYSDETDSATSLCDQTEESCRFEFHPAMVMLTWVSVDAGESHMLNLDRKRGTVIDVAERNFSGYSFTGTCARTQMPKPDASTYAF